MSVRYYQLGGFKGNITSPKSLFDEKDLANTIAGFSSPLRSKHNTGAPIDLVLGIKKSGTSHLLLTQEQINSFTRSRPSLRGNSVSAQDFESLSPISFDTVEGLTKQLTFLRPTKSANRDTSKANRRFDSRGIQVYRGVFEHGRVLYRIVNGLPDPTKYGCYDTSWKQDLRVSSFIFNVSAVDDRRKEDRIRNPRILDVGFCSAQLPGFVADKSTARHLINRNNALMGKRTAFTHGDSEALDINDLDARVKDFFTEYRRRCTTPTILLIYNEERTLAYLSKLGVDISAWTFSELKDLVFSGSSSRRPHYDAHHRPRSRSRSPPNSRGQYGYPPSFQLNRRSRDPAESRSIGSDPGRKLYAPVYVVDIEQLHNKLMNNDQMKSLTSVAEQLLGANIQGLCAGNEAVMAIEIWKEMISGLPIDEQRELRLQGEAEEQTQAASRSSSTAAGPSSSGQPQAPTIAGWDSEDDQDPNEYVPPVGGASSKPAQHRKTLSESDYGSDDDSDSDSN